MKLIALGLIFIITGFFLYTITYMYPILYLVYFDWIALIIVTLAWFATIYRMYVTKSYKQADWTPTWQHLINYMRRDNTVVPITGHRSYPGESFIDVPQLGLIEFLGKDCVYTWGDKKVLWGLENINYTPDPRFAGLCPILSELGFADSEDLKRVLSGNDLYQMGQVYINMLNYDFNHGGEKLVRELISYNKKPMKFKKHTKDDGKNKAPVWKAVDIIKEKMDKEKTKTEDEVIPPTRKQIEEDIDKLFKDKEEESYAG